MEEMILAEPSLGDALPASSEAGDAGALVRDAVAAGEPVRLVGCGTSEHAAQAGAELLRDALGSSAIVARDAFEASLDPQRDGVIIGVSHEAGTRATLAAIRAAEENGARAVLITAAPEDAPSGPLVVSTPLRDTSWCHTVGYLSPLLAVHAMAGAGAGAPRATIERMLSRRPHFAQAAVVLAGCARLLVVGSGADEITGRELALKLEEGVHTPATPLGVEKVLHGHLPAADAGTGLVLLRFDPRQAEARDARARDVAAAAAELSMPTVTLADGPATAECLRPADFALIAGALALQLLTLELVLAAGTNPDLIRREEPAYRAAAEAGGAG
jgi:glucosamine 6-phosphate synthetase-like amidotransferase/phosphosugar isomerase protein